jgi:hypothetical protein
MSTYAPEMGGKPDASRLFHGRICRNRYSLSWPVSRDSEARAMMKANRVRPCGPFGIERSEIGEWSTARIFGEAVYHCQVTYSGYGKLTAASETTTEVLLD